MNRDKFDPAYYSQDWVHVRPTPNILMAINAQLSSVTQSLASIARSLERISSREAESSERLP